MLWRSTTHTRLSPRRQCRTFTSSAPLNRNHGQSSTAKSHSEELLSMLQQSQESKQVGAPNRAHFRKPPSPKGLLSRLREASDRIPKAADYPGSKTSKHVRTSSVNRLSNPLIFSYSFRVHSRRPSCFLRRCKQEYPYYRRLAPNPHLKIPFLQAETYRLDLERSKIEIGGH